MKNFLVLDSGRVINIDAIAFFRPIRNGLTVSFKSEGYFDLMGDESIDFLAKLKDLGMDVMPIWKAIWGDKKMP
jgi:hypothetical protein